MQKQVEYNNSIPAIIAEGLGFVILGVFSFILIFVVAVMICLKWGGEKVVTFGQWIMYVLLALICSPILFAGLVFMHGRLSTKLILTACFLLAVYGILHYWWVAVLMTVCFIFVSADNAKEFLE